MSDNAKKALLNVQKKQIDDKKRKRSDIEHIDRRRSNSDRSCQTERRKRLGSTIIVLCVITLTFEDRDNEKEYDKKRDLQRRVV